MKKVVSLLLALLLVLSLAACGEQKTPDNSDPGTENTLNYPTSPHHAVLPLGGRRQL